MKELLASDKWKWRIAFAIVIAVTVIEYGPVFLSGRVPFPATIVNGFPPYVDEFPQGTPKPLANIGDLVTAFYPYHALAARAFRQGSLPLWNANTLTGSPFVGNTQSAIFYPPNYLYYFMDLKRAWALGLVLQRLFAVIFTVLLLRELGGTPTAAVVSALLFGFSGFLIAWQGQAMSSSAVWLPLICYASLRLHREPSGRIIALLAIALTMPVLAGHPETAVHLAITGLAFAAVLLFKRSDAGGVPNLKYAAGFIAAAVLAIGLASIQALPTLEWIRNAHRSLRQVWPSLPFPAILAFVSRDVMRATNSAGLDIPEQAAYLGMIVFLAAPLALFHTSKKLIAFIAAGCIVLVSIIYGIGPLLPLLNRIPYLGLKQWRLILVLSFGIAVLAGLGISALERMMERGEWKQSLRWKSAVVVAAGLAFGVLMIYLLRERTTVIVEPNRMPRASLLLLLAGAAILFARIAGWLSRIQFNILLVSLLAFDVLTFSYGFLPFQRAREVYPMVELFARLKQTEGKPFRIAALDDATVVNSELVYDLDTPLGYEIPLERLYRFLDDIDQNAGDGEGLDPAAMLAVKDRRVDMLNTRYILVASFDPAAAEFRKQSDRYRFAFTAGHTDVFENLRAMPRAFIVPASGIEKIADEALQLQRVKEPSFNPEQHVILAQTEPDDSSASAGIAANSANASVEWIHRDPNSFQVKASTPTAGVLVASQIYYPGWKASVDGVTVPVVPANFALAAIHLPSGQHDVRFFYAPSSIRIGAIVSALSLTIIVMLAWSSRRHPGVDVARPPDLR